MDILSKLEDIGRGVRGGCQESLVIALIGRMKTQKKSAMALQQTLFDAEATSEKWCY
jgi:hypothetical protein